MSRNVSGPMSLIRLKRKSLRHKDEKKRKGSLYTCDWLEYNYVHIHDRISFHSFYYSCVVTRFKKESRASRGGTPWLFGTKHTTTPCPVAIKSPRPSTICSRLNESWLDPQKKKKNIFTTHGERETCCATSMTRENTWRNKKIFGCFSPRRPAQKGVEGTDKSSGGRKKKEKENKVSLA